jgi:6-phosphogluconolactonase
MSDRPAITVAPDAEAVARRAADVMANHINDARARNVDAHIALSGGTSPRRAYELLAEMQGSWAGVHLWLADERCVPEDDEESNTRMIRETLLDRVRAADGPHLHHVRGDLGPEDAAWLYGGDVVRAMGERPVFDLIVLGMGPDGHTCSLFPEHPEADAEAAPVIGVRGSPKPPPERISLTMPVLTRARFTLLLVTGEDKADALAHVRAADGTVPAARLGDGLDEIVCDPAAAGRG